MRLAREGASGITMVDLSNDGLAETSALVSAANPKCVTRLISADVANAADLERAFRAHVHEFGDLHACFNNAGIGERAKWHSVVDVNLNAVIQGTRLAVDAMRGKMGSAKTTASDRVVVNVASAGGIFPMPQAPVYSATKAAVVLYSQSLAHLHKTHGVRVNALCPQFTDTALVQGQFQAIGRVRQLEVPAEFKMPVIIGVDFGDDNITSKRITVTGEVTEFDLGVFPEKPKKLIFNHLESVLCEIDNEKWKEKP